LSRHGRALALLLSLYGMLERLVLGLGMCWISGLAARALTRVS
jgi:hypothetical protein